MVRYTKLPQFDLEMQTSGKTIQSITISRNTRPDGSVIRRKETLLSDGTCLVDEQVMSSTASTTSTTSPLPFSSPSNETEQSAAEAKAANIHLIPATIDTHGTMDVTILPHHYKTTKTSKENQCTQFRCFLTTLALLLMIILLMQFVILCLLRGGGFWLGAVNELLGFRQ